jgi:Thymidylate synthase
MLHRITTGVHSNIWKFLQPISKKMGVASENGHISGETHDELQYLQQLKMIIEKGSKKGDRTGVGTLSVFGTQARFSLKDGMH